MHRQGVKKSIKGRSGRRQSMAGVGMVTKGSSGRPKAVGPAPRVATRGRTERQAPMCPAMCRGIF